MIGWSARCNGVLCDTVGGVISEGAGGRRRDTDVTTPAGKENTSGYRYLMREALPGAFTSFSVNEGYIENKNIGKLIGFGLPFIHTPQNPYLLLKDTAPYESLTQK